MKYGILSWWLSALFFSIRLYEGDPDGGGGNDNPPTTDELTGLIKAQATRISELEADAATHTGLQAEVAKLQETLGTQTSLTELVEQLKTMNTANPAPTESDKHASALQKAAEAGDQKAFRKLRQQA